MFTLFKPSGSTIDRFLRRVRPQTLSYAEVGATRGRLPDGYTVDRNTVTLGSGRQTFEKAAAALRAWEMFNLGWVRVSHPDTAIAVNETVAVLIHHLGFWSLNASRIVYTIDEDRRFGFAYGTVQDHAEQGEERFSVEWKADGSVLYDILAFSRPRQWQAKAGRPIARMLQKRFARDSMAAMKRAAT